MKRLHDKRLSLYSIVEEDGIFGARRMSNAIPEETETTPPPADYEEESMGSVFSEFMLTTSAHGLPRVVGDKTKLRRVIWLIIFLTAMSYFSIQFHDILILYFSFPIAVKTDILNRKKVDFPAVTVCNINKLKRSTLGGSLYSDLVRIDDHNVEKMVSLYSAPASEDKRKKRSTDYTETIQSPPIHQKFPYVHRHIDTRDETDTDSYHIQDSEEKNGEQELQIMPRPISCLDSRVSNSKDCNNIIHSREKRGIIGDLFGGGTSDDPVVSTTSNEGLITDPSTPTTAIHIVTTVIPDTTTASTVSDSSTETVATVSDISISGVSSTPTVTDASTETVATVSDISTGSILTATSPETSIDGGLFTVPETTTSDAVTITPVATVSDITTDGGEATTNSALLTDPSSSVIPVTFTDMLTSETPVTLSSPVTIAETVTDLNPFTVIDTAPIGDLVTEGDKITTVAPLLPITVPDPVTLIPEGDKITTVAPLVPITVPNPITEADLITVPSPSTIKLSTTTTTTTTTPQPSATTAATSTTTTAVPEQFEENPDEPFEFVDNGFLTGVESDYDFTGFLNKSRTSDLSDLMDVLKPSREELDLHGHQAEDFIIQCSFDKKNCTHEDFEKRYDGRYGLCYTFNHDQNNTIITTKFGSRYGLRLTLNIEADEYIGMFSAEYGARILVHPNNASAFPEYEGIDAPPGQKTAIGIQLTRTIRLADPYPTNCSDGENSDLIHPGVYSVLNCGRSCLHRKLIEICHCVDSVVMATDSPRCSLINITQEMCRQRVYYMYDNDILGCNCEVSCSDLTYSSSISSNEWPSRVFKAMMLERFNASFNAGPNFEQEYVASHAETNLVRVHIYFNDFAVVSIEEYPEYPWESLCADVGGLLGLFMGVSICTAIEFLEFLLDMIVSFFVLLRITCRKKKKARKVMDSNAWVNKKTKDGMELV